MLASTQNEKWKEITQHKLQIIMLHIRKQQLITFRQQAQLAFEDEIVDHLRKFAPKLCTILEGQHIRQVIQLGINRAKKYGFTNRGPVRFYIDLMTMLGSYFDTDPQYSWAAETLNNPDYFDQMIRAEALYDKTDSYLKAVLEPNKEHSQCALWVLSDLDADLPLYNDADLEQQMLAFMKSLFPEKYNYVGEISLHTLYNYALQEAEAYSLGTKGGKALFVGLMYMLGHGFARDPLYPLLLDALNNSTLMDHEIRISELKRKSFIYLDRLYLNIHRED